MLQRSIVNDCDIWLDYWRKRKQPWRSEPEIETKRQAELNQSRIFYDPKPILSVLTQSCRWYCLSLERTRRHLCASEQPVLHELAEWAESTTQDFAVALEQRADCLQKLATKPGISMDQMYEAINELREQERSGSRPSLKLGH